MSSGFTIDKLLIIAVIALILIGPERLPEYARKLGVWARQLRDWLGGAKERLRDEVGPEIDEIDWKQLDPRQYDPRRIIREALAEPALPVRESTRTAPRESAYAQRKRREAEAGAAETDAPAGTPFDAEAT